MTIQTATDYLRKFFANTSADWVSLQGIYAATNRESMDSEKNRTWVGNKMLYMKRHDLIEPTYEKKGNTKKLSGVRLTVEGKSLLGRLGEETDPGTPPVEPQQYAQKPNNSSNIVSLTEVLTMLAELNKRGQNKFQVDIKLKEGIVSVHMM